MTSKEEAFRKWGIVSLLLLELPMVVNTLLYYMYMQTTYGYMAIILLLTLPFVYPSIRSVAWVMWKRNRSREGFQEQVKKA